MGKVLGTLQGGKSSPRERSEEGRTCGVNFHTIRDLQWDKSCIYTGHRCDKSCIYDGHKCNEFSIYAGHRQGESRIYEGHKKVNRVYT